MNKPLVPARQTLLEAIAEATGADACLQCHKCTSGCPVAERMELQPAQIVRLLQLGAIDELLGSRAIWLCASCHTCSARCPAGVDLALIQDRLRELCLQQGRQPADRRSSAFHRALLATVEQRGRMNETGLVRRFAIEAGALTENVALGMALLRRGKVRLLGQGISRSGRREVAALLRDALPGKKKRTRQRESGS